ncbi:ParB/RepB/Spo0J family partition protein [Desnuesiella massiliensis]|uniref:ParB/RepB/Spo0J family partition protein n=1 Tax=Desnuesiella massiliensis TaxID=1650662 RepID=UPI0006E24942|nr:ParB/RepB/Spo0J family partition protein [Desnuesiella massiliensis]
MSKKFGLGKGLGALIPEEEKSEETKGNLISINLIKPNVDQPRKEFDKEKIMNLANSIKEHGIIQPLILKKQNESYVIVAGERRWRAAKEIGIKEIPAIVMELTDKQVLEISLIENIQREDLNPIEEAKAYKKLLEDFDLTQEELSTKIGKSRVAITNTLRLLNLDEMVQQFLIEGIITEGHGRALLALPNLNMQHEICKKIIDENLSVRDTERVIKNLLNPQSKEDKKKVETQPYLNDVKSKLENHFGTKVVINAKKNRGKIEIEYYSNDDLQRILDIINL